MFFLNVPIHVYLWKNFLYIVGGFKGLLLAANMPFTPVGSPGDIVALVNVIKDLVKAFDKIRGSSAEYQEINKKLWAFTRVLQKVETLCRSFEDTIELNASRDAIHSIVGQSQRSVDGFLRRTRKFQPALREGSSGNKLQGAARKAQWKLSGSDELAKFQAEIDVYCSILTAIASTANGSVPFVTKQAIVIFVLY